MKKSTSKKENTDDPGFPIVGIGTSAGGLETLEIFFKNVPENSGLAFVVIQHLDPNHEGMMPELLQRSTRMKVRQGADKLKIQPNHVYVIPPDKSMSVLNDHLYLFDPVETRGIRLPVDYFFRSLADDRKEYSIGVILSGMGSDGSLGVKAIKEKNGIVAVQEPSTAKYEGMPRNAVNAVVADILAPVNQLPEKLIAFLNHAPAIVQKSRSDDIITNNLKKIVILLREHTGHDFSMYKKESLFRRLERRMSVHQIDNIANYVKFLQENPTETDILFKELLIGVTNFFRNPDVWENLKENVFPELFNEAPDDYVFRAWVTGCSTGEEAFSLAIVFMEAYEKVERKRKFTLKIFATDIDNDAIQKARKGLFSANIANDVPPERLNRFFVKEGDGYRIKPHIREMVIFASQNVISEPPFTRMDLLLCRNLLIYMESELQDKMMNLFHYALKPGGVMILGNAENERSHKKLFKAIDDKLKTFKRTGGASDKKLLDFPRSHNQRTQQSNENIMQEKAFDNIQTLADQFLIQHFAPASVLIGSDGDILYITGRTGKYLEPAAGKANMNIYAMARKGLQNELPGAIRKAKQNYEQVTLNKLNVGTNDGSQIVDISLQQIEEPEAIKGTIMIVFTDVADVPQPTKSKLKSSNKKSTTREQELEKELERANEELKSLREDMQTAQEELHSTNEELQSKNEELQSTNEELTTSKEEMQSLNEELQTLNAELQRKVDDYEAANNDIRNLLNSTEIATLFLDKELNIRRFTEKIKKLFKLRPSDIGRPIDEIVNELQYPELTEHANEVLRTLLFKEIEITTDNQHWLTIRIMPYQTVDERIDGIVITFIDKTQQKIIENNLHELKSNFEHTLEKTKTVLAICNTELRYTWVFNKHPDLENKNLLGKRDDEIDRSEGSLALLKLKKQVLDTGKPADTTIIYSRNEEKEAFHVIAAPIHDKQGNISGISTCETECVYEKSFLNKKGS